MTEETKKPDVEIVVQESKPFGRPTLYNPRYCDDVVELGKHGKSREQIACALNVGTTTLDSWCDVHPEFRGAMDMAKVFEQNWWEEKAQDHMVEYKDGPKLNAGIWSRSMAARFPKKYREQIKQEITGKDGAPFVSGIEITFVKPKNE